MLENPFAEEMLRMLEASTMSLLALKMDMLLAKAGPKRHDGNTSLITYLRRNQKERSGTVLFPAREEEEVRTCEENNMETPRSAQKEGQELLQAPELRFLCRPGGDHGEAAVPCSPWGSTGIQRSTHSPWGSMGDAEIHPQPLGIHRDAEIHPQPLGIHRDAEIHPQPLGIHRDAEIHPQPLEEVPTPEWESLEKALVHWETQWREGALLPGWSSLSLEHCTLWEEKSTSQHFWKDWLPLRGTHFSNFGRIAAREAGTTWRSSQRTVSRGRDPTVQQGKNSFP
ncbi:hypothetical protein HGM15179_003786 [Zosterops borbonicus]|uniref:Uncharacterized protein n=1 Tax=Zosterops borbonicus TaxID=364589 RepID=A0A8K1GTW2_9PASS|nr:hypothetical protein HGM15179_003786 [Zosterops borbonicus]